jgi:hypothetical protein
MEGVVWLFLLRPLKRAIRAGVRTAKVNVQMGIYANYVIPWNPRL